MREKGRGTRESLDAPDLEIASLMFLPPRARAQLSSPVQQGVNAGATRVPPSSLRVNCPIKITTRQRRGGAEQSGDTARRPGRVVVKIKNATRPPRIALIAG